MNTIIYLNGKHYCAFCGKEITTRDIAGTFQCHCEDAKEYRNALHLKLQFEIQASNIMASAPKPKYGLHTIIAPIEDRIASLDENSDEVPSNPL